MKLTIDRSSWTTGYLHRIINGRKCYCALGFVAKALNTPDHTLLDACGLSEFAEEELPADIFACGLAQLVEGHKGTYLTSTDLADEIVDVNDSMHGIEREERLAELFAKAGFDVEFVSSLPEYEHDHA